VVQAGAAARLQRGPQESHKRRSIRLASIPHAELDALKAELKRLRRRSGEASPWRAFKPTSARR
jgi:hypothetical protein